MDNIASGLAPLCDIDAESFVSQHRVRAFCNWLLPGSLMLGTNPNYGLLLTPRQRLTAILDSGITVFYALQLEVPDQEDLADDAPGWADERPYRPLALQLAAECAQPPQQLVFRRFGIQDMGRPTSVEDVVPVVAELENRIRKGEKVYLHCRGGVGRAGTIGACFLVYSFGLTAEDALQRVQRAYDTRGGAGISPETDDQAEFVREFERALEDGSITRPSSLQ